MLLNSGIFSFHRGLWHPLLVELFLLWPERRITHLLPERFIRFTNLFVILNINTQYLIAFQKNWNWGGSYLPVKLSGLPLSVFPWKHRKYGVRWKKNALMSETQMKLKYWGCAIFWFCNNTALHLSWTFVLKDPKPWCKYCNINTHSLEASIL